MAEQIGLSAVFDMSNFNSGMSKYMDATGKASSATEKAAGGMGKAWMSLGDTASKAAAVLGGAVVAASAAAGAAIVGFTAGGIQKAADLEEGLSRVAAALNITKEQVGPLKDLINQLGLDPNLKVTAVEAAQAIENLAKNGLSMQQILDGAARSTVLLANATGADFGTAADIATDVMQQFNIEAKDMGQVVDGIAATTNLSKFGINDYRLALSQAGGVASSVGVEFDDFNTTIAAISPLFASGSDAGTALKTTLLRLVPNTTPATEAMGELGLMTFDTTKAMKMLGEAGIKPASESFNDIIDAMIQYYGEAYNVDVTTQEGIDKFGKWSNEVDLMSNAFFDANGNLKDMSEITAILHEATKDLNEEQKNQYFNTIFGTDAMRAAFAMADSGVVVYTDAALAAKELGVSQEAVNKVIEGGVTQFEALQLQMAQVDANEQARVRMDNFKGAMEILQGVIEAVQMQIGDAFLPVLTEMAKKFTELASQYGPLVVAWFQGLATAISDLIRYIGEFITTGQPFNKFFYELTPTLQTVVLGIGAFTLILQQASGLVSNSIGSFVEWKDVLIVLGAAIATVVIPALWGMITAMAPVIAVFAGAVLAVAAVRTAWEADFLGIQTTTLAALDAIKAAFQPLTDAIAQFGSGALTEIQNFVTGNQTEFTNLSAIWEGAKTSASNLFTGIVSYVTTNLPTWQAKLTEWGTAAAQWIIDAHAAVLTNLATWSAAIIGYVTANLPAWQASLTAWATAAWQWISSAIAPAATAINSYVSGLVGSVTAQLPNWKTALLNWTTAAWQWIVDAASQVAAKITEWYGKLKAEVDGKLPGWKTAFTEWIKASWQWIVDAAGQVAAKVGEWYGKLEAAVDAKLPTWKAAFVEWAKALTTWITDSIADVATAIDQWFTRLRSRLLEKLPDWKTELLKFATALVTWIGDKAADALPALGAWLGKIVAWIPLGVLALGRAIIKMAGALVGWIAGGEGASKSESAAGKTDAAMAEFQKALLDALSKVGQAFLVAVQNFVESFAKTMGEHVNWNQVGQDILNKIKAGWEAGRDAVYGAVAAMVEQMVSIITETDWAGLGQDILDKIKNGISSTASKVINEMGKLASDAAKKFISYDWLGLGKSIIDGILKGLKENGSAIVDYLYGLGEQALDKIKAFFGISSPSKVMEEVGRNLILGWEGGMKRQAPQLIRTMREISATVLGIIVSQQDRTLAGLTGRLGELSSLAGPFLSAVEARADAIDQQLEDMGAIFEPNISRFPGDIPWELIGQKRIYGGARDTYNSQKTLSDNLTAQANLIDYVKKAGLDVAGFFRGIQLGPNANPADLLRLLTNATAAMNRQLQYTLDVATKGYDKLVESLRGGRRTIDQMISEFTAPTKTQLDVYRDELARLDTQIAGVEENILSTGSEFSVAALKQLQERRDNLTRSIRDYLSQKAMLESITADTLTGVDAALARFNSPASTAEERKAILRYLQQINVLDALSSKLAGIEGELGTRFKTEIFDPTAIGISNFRGMTEGRRQEQLDFLSRYIDQIKRFQTVQKDLSGIIGFNPLVARYAEKHLDAILDKLYDINTTEAQRNQLIEQYRAEQEKLVALQQKQQQLEFLQQQLDLVDQLKQLNQEFDDIISVENLLSGITFGVNASLDDMLTLTNRTIEAMIKTVKYQLDIASPSKVMAEIGEQMMAGLGVGIRNAAQYPTMALASASQQVPYALTNSRTMNINMGGVNISNGMDDVMFEARVRQVVEGMI